MNGIEARARLRLNQQRRLDHACDVIAELIRLHIPNPEGEREAAELAMMKARLTALIKHQHIINPEYKAHKIAQEGY